MVIILIKLDVTQLGVSVFIIILFVW